MISTLIGISRVIINLRFCNHNLNPYIHILFMTFTQFNESKIQRKEDPLIFSAYPLRAFVLCLVCPMLPVSLNCSFLIAPSVYLFCLSSSWVLCAQCYQFLSIVHSWLPLQFSLTFVLCLVCSMLSVSLDCPFLVAPSVFSNLRPESCVLNVTSFPRLSILDCPFGFL